MPQQRLICVSVRWLKQSRYQRRLRWPCIARYVDLWLRGKDVCMGLQLISIEYVTKKNHCQAAGEETNIFYHPLVLHLKRVHLQYLHHHRRTLFSLTLRTE